MNSSVHLDEYVDLRKYWLVLKRQCQPAFAVASAVIGLSLITVFSMDRVYEAEAKLLIKADRSAKLTGLENGSGEIKGLTTDSNPLLTEAEVIKSRPIINKLIKELDLRNDDGELFKYKDIADGFQIQPTTGTDILEVIYTGDDPEFAALAVNKAVELYVKDHTLYNRSETASARDFIDKQLPEVEARVRKAEANLREFKNQNRIASLEEETTANIDSLSIASNKIDEIEGELENVDARYNRLETQLNMSWQEASAVSALSQSAAVQRVLEQLQEVRVTLTKRRNYLSENAPQVIALKKEEEDLTTLLDRQIAETLGQEQQAIVNQVNILSLGDLKQQQIAEFANLGLRKEGLEKQLITLENTYESYKQKSDSLPKLQEQERELERRVEAAQSTYQTLLTKLQETKIAEQQNTGNVRVVSSADVPEDPVGPKKKMIVAGGVVAGTLLGLLTAFLLDIRDKTIKNTEEIRQMLPYSLTSVIPDLNRIKSNKKQLFLPDNSMANLAEIAVTHLSNLPFKEAYHNLQINLNLLDCKAANKVIVVSSSIAEEGKSTVSANLAIAQAQCGKKVLLIDGDLRRPSQHNLWRVKNDLGLTDIIQQDVKWNDALCKVMPNLDLITSGSRTNHPVSILNSSFVQTLIIGLSSYYDCIIIDTPPAVGLADSKILAKLADGLLFVARPGVANYSSIAAAREVMEDKDINVLGVVANGVDFNLELHGYEAYYADKKYLEAG